MAGYSSASWVVWGNVDGYSGKARAVRGKGSSSCLGLRPKQRSPRSPRQRRNVRRSVGRWAGIAGSVAIPCSSRRVRARVRGLDETKLSPHRPRFFWVPTRDMPKRQPMVFLLGRHGGRRRARNGRGGQVTTGWGGHAACRAEQPQSSIVSSRPQTLVRVVVGTCSAGASAIDGPGTGPPMPSHDWLAVGRVQGRGSAGA